MSKYGAEKKILTMYALISLKKRDTISNAETLTYFSIFFSFDCF